MELYPVGKKTVNLPADANADKNDTIDQIRKLRSRGLSVTRIATLLDEDEFLVARCCGVQLWKGRNTITLEIDK